MNKNELHNYLRVVDGRIHFDVEGKLFLLSIESAFNMLIALFGVLSRMSPHTLDGLYCLHCGDPMSEHLITERGGACAPIQQWWQCPPPCSRSHSTDIKVCVVCNSEMP